MRSIGASVLALLVVVAVSGAWWWWRSSIEFDSTQWKKARATACLEDVDGTRARMLGDLRDGHLRQGLTQSQVVALLGPPDRRRGSTLQWGTHAGLRGCLYLSVVFEEGRLVRTDRDVG